MNLDFTKFDAALDNLAQKVEHLRLHKYYLNQYIWGPDKFDADMVRQGNEDRAIKLQDLYELNHPEEIDDNIIKWIEEKLIREDNDNTQNRN